MNNNQIIALRKINNRYKQIYYSEWKKRKIKLDLMPLVSHVNAVKDLSLKILKEFEIKDKLLIEKVKFIALFHDIGRLECKPFGKNEMILHGIYSKIIMRKYLLHYSELKDLMSELLNGIASHVGVGITKDEFLKILNSKKKSYEIKRELRDYVPRTLAQMLVCYVDNLIVETHEIPFHESLSRFYEKLGKRIGYRYINLQMNLFKSLLNKAKRK